MKFKSSTKSNVSKRNIKEGLVNTQAHLDAAKRYRELASVGAEEALTRDALNNAYVREAACEYGIPAAELRETLCEQKDVLKEDIRPDKSDEKVLNSSEVKQAMKTLSIGKEDVVMLDFDSLDDYEEQEEDKDDLFAYLDEVYETNEFIVSSLDTSKFNVTDDNGGPIDISSAQIINPLLIGQAGTGKTSIVNQWAKSRGVNLVAYDLSTTPVETFGGVPMPADKDNPEWVRTSMNISTYQALSKPKTVIFFDELNRATGRLRSAVMKLVNQHIINGPYGAEFLPEVIFTIGAINPATSSYSGTYEMDNAEYGRYVDWHMTVDKVSTLKHLDKNYEGLVKIAVARENPKQARQWQGRRALVRKLLLSRQFQFTSQEEEDKMSDDRRFRPTTPRNLEKALNASDGTKESFLKLWDSCCDYRQKKTIEDILKDYTDIDDKANQALAGGTSSSVIGNKYQKTVSNVERIAAIAPDHGIDLDLD